MKISIAWIFDHLGVDWRTYDIRDLITQLSAKTAEIDGFKHYTFTPASFSLVQVTAFDNTHVQVRCIERKKNISLPPRGLSQSSLRVNDLFLVTQEGAAYRWATLADCGAERDGLMPSLRVPSVDKKTGNPPDWHTQVETEDWIIEIDNKSLTNRPDLWGHRGFAREIAALLNIPLLPEERLCGTRPIRHYEKKSPLIDLTSPLDSTRPSACTRFAGIKLTSTSCEPSLLPIAHRLARVDAKPMNAWVDLTNYVMYDWGQPMHAFDANHVTGSIQVRFAYPNEPLTLLDGDKIELSDQDCVVADEKQALSVAGIMGGQASAISNNTTSVFLESAHFEPTTIRRSAARLKKRTESSARFEKNLDPNQNTVALERYLTLAEKFGLSFKADETITSVGTLAEEHTIDLTHKNLVEKLGTTITEGQVRSILMHLEFGVQIIDGSAGLSYRVTIPTFRGTKDVRIPEDLIEEIARSYGYDNIPALAPTRSMRPFSTETVFRKRMIKRHCAFALSMREVETYPLYDESFLKKVGLTITDAPEILNPLSENSRRLVTSLIPHLLQGILHNAVAEKQLRLFELNRTWSTSGSSVENPTSETQVASGVFYNRSGFNFYDGKAALESLFMALDLFADWKVVATNRSNANRSTTNGSKPNESTTPPWSDAHQIAEIWINGVQLGYAGMVNPRLMSTIAEGEAFAFELNSTLLTSTTLCTKKKFESPSRFQAVSLDISMLTPREITVGTLEDSIARADARIRDVNLVDLFEKEEWGSRRSIAIRYIVQDDEKTLSKEDIEAVQKAVVSAVLPHGVEVR
ncbi:TPA: phenylalanine--tRNA ligase subunit beta [Candidatus Dependentiae bacterium]|nr:MAG: Phenylalanine-tRNA ligase beta subunit [candidate division TM6 bacterium GW2011_GWF2_43_87]HBL98537.1 phenylalanine--tRNA ligase subunit beta [Candidatus Dependentiae bacterium]